MLNLHKQRLLSVDRHAEIVSDASIFKQVTLMHKCCKSFQNHCLVIFMETSWNSAKNCPWEGVTCCKCTSQGQTGWELLCLELPESPGGMGAHHVLRCPCIHEGHKRS